MIDPTPPPLDGPHADVHPKTIEIAATANERDKFVSHPTSLSQRLIYAFVGINGIPFGPISRCESIRSPGLLDRRSSIGWPIPTGPTILRYTSIYKKQH